MTEVKNAASVEEVRSIARNHVLTVVSFWAEWCEPCKEMNAAFAEIAHKTRASRPEVAFVQVDAEAQGEVAENFEVEAVPYFVFLRGDQPAGSLEGADAPALVSKVGALVASLGAAAVSGEAGGDLRVRLQQLTTQAPVMLFMKGTPDEPRCGFSNKMVKLLRDQGVAFGSFDILSDQTVREGLKQYSNWPTYPQLYAGGKLVGGLDVVNEMVEAGEFQSLLPESMETRLRRLISQAPVMLFMKGTPDEPRCGFSGKIVKLLRDQGVAFGSFDILSDQTVREGLKQFSNWPTYPQLYAGGKLVGGLDVVSELASAGELRDALIGK